MNSSCPGAALQRDDSELARRKIDAGNAPVASFSDDKGSMRYEPIDPQLFIANRARLQQRLLPNSLVAINANDIPLTNADGTLALPANSDLFYLTGIEQEQTILLLYPDADEEKHRAVLFLREPTDEMEIWEGRKLTKEQARAISADRSGWGRLASARAASSASASPSVKRWPSRSTRSPCSARASSMCTTRVGNTAPILRTRAGGTRLRHEPTPTQVPLPVG